MVNAPSIAGMAVALPMYLPGDRNAVQAFWSALAEMVRQRHGIDAPGLLTWPDDLYAHWLQSDLLLSQACGYPLSTALRGKVQVVGTFSYDVPGASGLLCRSQLICRADDSRSTLAAFANSRLAFNSTDSQSGYNALRALVATLPHQAPFFAAALETGGHVASIERVQKGEADMAAIDCVTLALWRSANPDLRNGITVFAQSAPYPGLPLITALSTPPPVLDALRECLLTMAGDAQYRQLRAPLGITGFAATTLSDYAVCLEMEAAGLARAEPLFQVCPQT